MTIEALIKCCEECTGDQNCECTKYCMCGCTIESHDIGSGHSPVSIHDYAIDEIKNKEKSKCLSR